MRDSRREFSANHPRPITKLLQTLPVIFGEAMIRYREYEAHIAHSFVRGSSVLGADDTDNFGEDARLDLKVQLSNFLAMVGVLPDVGLDPLILTREH